MNIRYTILIEDTLKIITLDYAKIIIPFLLFSFFLFYCNSLVLIDKKTVVIIQSLKILKEWLVCQNNLFRDRHSHAKNKISINHIINQFR